MSVVGWAFRVKNVNKENKCWSEIGVTRDGASVRLRTGNFNGERSAIVSLDAAIEFRRALSRAIRQIRNDRMATIMAAALITKAAMAGEPNKETT